MIKLGKILIIAISLLSGKFAAGQTDKEKALEKGRQAIKLEDEGKYDQALALLNEAQKLDPENYNYPYEIGYTYFLQKEYKKAITVFEKVVKYKDATDQCFQMLGSLYDYVGDTTSAFRSYNDGLKLFPNSGKLYLEKGTVYWGFKEYGKALPYYEQGIIVDPKFASNYYRAARIYCNSTEEVWGMIYGEIFMNLERNSERTSEISKLLYDTYKSEIKFTSDSSMAVSFCQQMTMDANKISDSKKFTLPFCMVYEPTLLLSVVTQKKIDLNSLDKIRTGFVSEYFRMGHNKTHPNILFDYQNKIKAEGHLEAYNHWVLMKGDEDKFDSWLSGNKEKWDNFIKWFTENKLLVDNDHRFFSGQY